ncbi:unnamed protein product [Rotaria sordida]|uniref:Uncharacterized protein n=1 Tax=Rotaria sordida TaxID=392033 RepID=A0A819TE21_9BILA|nr:unnamed protein product [Rotaria sordida]
MNKLSNIDILYSLIGVNRKLDRLARDITFTRSLDLVTISSNEHNDSRNKLILNRFCFDIIPRIQQNIECLILDPLLIDRVLCIGNYPKLRKLTLVNLQFEMASRIFNGKSSFIGTFQHQISHLTVTIHDDSTGELDGFDDCLCLLDGRLSQLHTFIVKVGTINNTSKIMNKNTRILFNLKCFSLISCSTTIEYDNQIVPLLRQMSQLETLTLSLIVCNRTSFIDGTHLVNDIISKMSYLHSFICNIITEDVTMDEEHLPVPDDAKSGLIQRGYSVNCYVDYNVLSKGECHIYSIPFSMDSMEIRSKWIEARELLGASYANIQSKNSNLDKSIQHLIISYKWRIEKNLPKIFSLGKMYFDHQKETVTYNYNNDCETLTEFNKILSDSNITRLHIEYLLIQERILGQKKNKQYCRTIRFYVALLADRHQYDASVRL